MTTTAKYPSATDHRDSWHELAKGIAALKDKVGQFTAGENLPGKKGELTIIGSGIETIGFSVGDQKLIEAADKVFYCVADPGTIVWLKKLRPDALDLYVLYGDNKVRYTTYMQMTEAQLYYVRQGMKVVCVFYGHPGIFVLSTHRAIAIARREGHKAMMKAGVCALDTLCADLGVDPCYPGMQTHEATDMMVRQRKPDPTLHVVLWQVGLIGEMGFRRHGYLNSNFSCFIEYLQEVYGPDYVITHYIGSRYPTIPSLIQQFKLSELHNPEVQQEITGLSTFYIPPRDVMRSDIDMVLKLGIVKQAQILAKPESPLREIDRYGAKEMKAFDAYAKFEIPKSYLWQEETEASKFLIALRFDIDLQERYANNPEEALADPRFSNLSDRERAMLLSRDAAAIQIAVKGLYRRSEDNERLLSDVFWKKDKATALMKQIRGVERVTARQILRQWSAEQGYEIELDNFDKSIDSVNRNHLYPWTGVYIDQQQQVALTIIGNRQNKNKSLIYINNQRVHQFKFVNGVLKWEADHRTPFNGFIKIDIDANGSRRLLGKYWAPGSDVAQTPQFNAVEADPDRQLVTSRTIIQPGGTQLLTGQYFIRTNGRHARTVNKFVLTEDTLQINNVTVTSFELTHGTLRWQGGSKDCYSGTLNFLIDPIVDGIEVYGQSKSKDFGDTYVCYGASAVSHAPQYRGPEVPDWAKHYLMQINLENKNAGGLMLWHKWEKFHHASTIVNKLLYKII